MNEADTCRIYVETKRRKAGTHFIAAADLTLALTVHEDFLAHARSPSP